MPAGDPPPVAPAVADNRPSPRRTLEAARLGWLLAEVRGRLRTLPADVDPAPPPRAPAPRPGAPVVLPLRPQLPPADSLRTAVQALLATSPRLAPTVHPTLADQLVTASAGRTPAAAARRRARTVEAMADWDLLLQEALASEDDLLANAYLVGRALAECFWDLEAEPAASDAARVAALFDPARRTELTRMLGRVAPQLPFPLTAPVIAGSVEAWGVVAADPAWRTSPGLRDGLREQTRRWYALLILGQDPSTIGPAGARLGTGLAAWRLAQAFWPQLSVAVVATGSAALAFVHGLPDGLGRLLAAGGVSTVLAAGLAARARDATQQLTLRLRQDIYTDLVSLQVVALPPAPGEGADRRRASAEVRRAVRARTLTVPTSTPGTPVR